MPAESAISAVGTRAESARASLRRHYRQQRRAVSGDRRRHAEASIVRAIAQADAFARARRVAMYRAFDGEVDLTLLETVARQADKPLLYARIAAADSPLSFVRPNAWNIHRNGLPEPQGPSSPLGPGDLLLVPGVAFDDAGVRLGLGGGHYDRTLAQTQIRAIGVCFECQRTDRLPRAPWDMPVAAVVTERGVLNFDTEESQV